MLQNRLTVNQVKTEIIKRLKERKKTLKHLGARRSTSTEQRQYLIDVSMNFQRIVTEALTTNYGRSDVFDKNQSLRLVTAAVNRSEAMSTVFAQKGHTYHFEKHSSNDVSIVENGAPAKPTANWVYENEAPTSINDISVDLERPAQSALSAETETPEEDSPSGKASNTGPYSTIPVRLVESHPDVEEFLPEASRVSEPHRDEIFSWLQDIYRESRGFELGSFNPILLGTILKEQSRKWQDLALGYIADIIVLTHTFVNDLLYEVCPVKRVREGILSLLMEDLALRYKRATNHAEFLLEVNLNGTPSTLNHYFSDNLQKCRQERMRGRLEGMKIEDKKLGDVIRFGDLFHHTNMSNEEHTIQDLHDILQSYYKVARKRFVDDLRMYAADHFLISGKDTPLTLFSPAFVAGLTEEQLEEAAGEDRQVKRQRASLEKETHDLEEATKILR